VTRAKLTVGIEFHTAHCGLSDRRRWPDGATPQTVVCPVLLTITKKGIGPIPIPPNTGKYWPIPNTPIPVSFEPYKGCNVLTSEVIAGSGKCDADGGWHP